MDVSDAERLRDPEAENALLKKLLVETLLERGGTMSAVLRKTY